MTAEAVLFGLTGEPAPTTCLVSLLCVTQANMVLLADCASSCSMSFGESCGDHMKLWQVALFAYAVFYFMLAGIMEAENLSQSYPIAYIAFSMVAQTLVVGGVALFGLEKGSEFASVWRWLFPLLVLELAVGIVFDASYQADPGGLWMNELFGLWLAAPAYYFNFRIARYTG
jgi:hypothetical protein